MYFVCTMQIYKYGFYLSFKHTLVNLYRCLQWKQPIIRMGKTKGHKQAFMTHQRVAYKHDLYECILSLFYQIQE